MKYISYSNGKFSATGKRPENQSKKEVLEKIAKRLTKYLNKHADLSLTELQKRFIDKVKNPSKKHGKSFLTKEKSILLIISLSVKSLHYS